MWPGAPIIISFYNILFFKSSSSISPYSSFFSFSISPYYPSSSSIPVLSSPTKFYISTSFVTSTCLFQNRVNNAPEKQIPPLSFRLYFSLALHILSGRWFAEIVCQGLLSKLADSFSWDRNVISSERREDQGRD